MRNEVKEQIDSLIKNHSVVLFMKGTKDRPQCGFSKQVAGILNSLVPDFVDVDVLKDPELRDGIKTYSSWPTIPQLYINQEFIGGCDIVLDLFNNNELQGLLKLTKAVDKPVISISDEALSAFGRAQSDMEEGEFIRITIGSDFSHELSFDQPKATDFTFTFGDISVAIDPYSAARAHQMKIDYVEDGLEAGFAFDNPNEPPMVNELSVEELKAWHDQKKDMLLIDVRPEAESKPAHISFAKALESMNSEALAALKKDQILVFHCHHGGRSRRVAESFRLKGFTQVYNLSGGIDAWSRVIDRSIPIY